MSLKQRLDRLTHAQPRTARGLLTVEDVRAAARPGPLHPAPVQEALDDLRQQMRALLARGERPRQGPAQPRARAARASVESLPFLQRGTPAGPLWQRVDRLAVSHRVGRVAVELASLAEPQILAELALDPRVADSSPETWLFLDTETTGFGGAGTLAFLIGMAAFDASGVVVVEQLLLREPAQERALLERVAERVRAASLIVSFNGKAFDRPLLEGRYVMNRMGPLPERPHLDLLHIGRRLHQRRLGRCTLKRMESEVLGFERGDDIDGSEVAAMYTHFLRHSDASGLAAVVSHNFWDVVSMVALVGLYGQRLPPLVARDLAGLARTLKRAGAISHAEQAAQAACEQGGGSDAWRVRAELAKSRGDCSSAAADFELYCRETNDPSGRLELCKLYEHKLQRPAQALRWLALGTGEDSSAHARRRERLERKLRRNPAP